MNYLIFEREPRAAPTDINLYKCSVNFLLFPYRKILLSKSLSGHCHSVFSCRQFRCNTLSFRIILFHRAFVLFLLCRCQKSIGLSVHIVDLDITCFPFFSESSDFVLSDTARKIRINLGVIESFRKSVYEVNGSHVFEGQQIGRLKNVRVSNVWLEQVSQPLVSNCGPSRIRLLCVHTQLFKSAALPLTKFRTRQ